MNINLKLVLITFFLFIYQISTVAQKGEFSISPTIGLNVPILDNDGLGFHIGINPAYSISSFVAIEGQVSFAYVKDAGFSLSGRASSQSNLNALVGGRFYIFSDEGKTQPYFNLLIGGMYNSEADYMEYVFGGSVGGFVEINKFLLGASFETPGNIIIKVGYVF